MPSIRVEKEKTRIREKMIVKNKEITLGNFLGHLKEEIGATAVEYALLGALIAAVIAATVALIGPALLPGFTTVIDGLP